MCELLERLLPYNFPQYLKEILSNPILLTLTIVSIMYFYYQFKRKIDQGDFQISMSIANFVAVAGIAIIMLISF